MVSTRQDKKTKLWRYELYISSMLKPDRVSGYIYETALEAADAGALELEN